MKVLVACEFSGRVRDAFIKRGHDAMSCDLLPTDSPGPHYQGDVEDILHKGWDLMIAHPPCTYLANSGVQHLWNKRKKINGKNLKRWEKMEASVAFFQRILWNEIPMVAVENPVPHGYAGLPKYDQIIHPWQHGHEVMKKTCLWLRGLPKLMPSKIVSQGEKYIGKNGKSNGSKWYQLPPSKDRWKHRSTTFEGIANAMADQWGSGALEWREVR